MCKICAALLKNEEALKLHLKQEHAPKRRRPRRKERITPVASGSKTDGKAVKKIAEGKSAEVAEEYVSSIRKGAFYFFPDGHKCQSKKEAIEYAIKQGLPDE